MVDLILNKIRNNINNGTYEPLSKIDSCIIEKYYKSKLKIKQCVEPTLDSKYLNPTEMELSLSKTTMNTALSDLPIVLIWELQKLKNK